MRNLGHWLMQQLCWDPTVRLGTCRPRPESRGPGTGARGDPEGSCIVSPTQGVQSAGETACNGWGHSQSGVLWGTD